MRCLLFALVLILGGSSAMVADESTSALGRKLAKLEKKFAADEAGLKKKLADAKEPDERKQVEFLTKELYAFTAADAVELADDGKKEEGGLEAAVFALKLLGKYNLTGDDMNKAIAIILDNHVNNPKIGPALAQMVPAGSTGLQFIETVAEKSTNKEVQGLAFYYQALALDAKATSLEGQSTDEYLSKVRVEAIDLMEKAVKTAPDAKIGMETIAKASIQGLANLKFGVGFPAPDVEGIDLDGKKVKLSSYHGKVVLVDFWATWCGPCVAMIPHERELVSKMKDKPFAMIGVDVDTEKSTVNEFLGKEKMPWNHWWDGAKGPLAKTFKINAYPTLYLIDAKGIIRKKWIGSPGNEVIDKAVEELVAETEKGKK